MNKTASLALSILILLTVSCQKPGEPVVPMTQEQWRRVDAYLIDELPPSATETHGVFGGNIELVGWKVEPRQVKAGESFDITFYWKAQKSPEKPWDIFVHLEGNGERETVDHNSASGVLPVIHWPDDKIIVDTFSEEAPKTLDGSIKIYMGLYQGKERLPITSKGNATSDGEDRLMIGTFESQWEAPEYAARWLTGDLNLDGRLSERQWSKAPATPRWVHPRTGERVESQHTWAKVLWDKESLYVGIRARDTDVWSKKTKRDDNLWEEEVLEVYLDPKRDGKNYLEIQVNPNNAIFDALFPEVEGRDHTVARNHTVKGMKTAVHVQGTVNERNDRDIYWSAELKIPWSSIPDFEQPPTNGSRLGLNLYRYDRNKDSGTKTTAWSPVGSGSFHRPGKFGNLRLLGEPTPQKDKGASTESDK